MEKNIDGLQGIGGITAIDISDIFSNGGCVEDIFRLKEIEQRKLYLNGGVDEDSANDIVRHIIQYNLEDSGKEPGVRKPIIIYITSLGGDVMSGLGLIDTIMMSKTPVYTINLGYEYSMGLLIGLAGHKRYTMPSASFLLHDGDVSISNSGFKAQNQMEFIRGVDEKIKQYVLSRTTLTEKEYDEKAKNEWYMFAEEAKEKGFTDYIIGKDCEIDSIV